MTFILWIFPIAFIYLVVRHMVDQQKLRIEKKKRLNAQLALAKLIKALENQSQYDIDLMLTEIEEKYSE